ncbi:MAG: DUF3995 domain-containing protein [Methylococcaceae bacterium]|nr:DUF3995 domain-containing protein [Methylococcaceae bacterium]
MITIAFLLIAVFLGLSLLHFYWLLGGRLGLNAAIPEIDGKSAFLPSTTATLVVAIGLGLCASLIAATAGVLTPPLPYSVLVWLTRALALVLLLRAIGDFRLIGFFKRIRGSRFARLDTVVYSPLCLVLAIAVAMVGFITPA